MTGLAVTAGATPNTVAVSSGAAIDPTGRLLELESPIEMAIKRDGVVVIRYTETLTHPVASLTDDPVATRAEESAVAG